MNAWFISIFLTFVLAFHANANPHIEAPKVEDTKEEPAGPPPEAFKNDLLSITPVKEPTNMTEYSRKFSKADYFYPYRQALTPRFGLVFGLRDSSDTENIMHLLLGFNYLLPRETSPHFELGADLSLASQGHINLMRRYIYNERGGFRPYYKYGVMHKLVAEEKFASLSNWDNYLAKIGIGFEDIMRPPRSLRIELEAAMGAEDIFIMFSYGFSYGW